MQHRSLVSFLALFASQHCAFAQIPNFHVIVIDPLRGSRFDARGCSSASDLGLVVGRSSTRNAPVRTPTGAVAQA